jgi:GNAT superfamily N-acetyltransferase
VIRNLRPTDVIVLLTPVVIPVSQDPVDTADPFECFGRALASRHPRIRHVPYTNTNGITSTHVGFVKRATVVIFVMSEISRSGDSPQIQAAHVTQALTHERPLLIVLTCNSQDPLQFAKDFPTIIQSKDYSRPTLELTASLIFGEHVEANAAGSRLTAAEGIQPKLWPVEQWNESRDINSVHYLWVQSMDLRFELPVSSLASLLRRPGYARHYVVRDTSGQLLGFCATYLSYVDQAGEKLIASLAILLVRSDHQRRGIGLSLHNHAIDQLKRTRGVARLQLGSTFPRILYGPPFNMQVDQGWFSRRGWRMDRDYPGQGKSVHDLVLDFDDWNYPGQDRTTQFRNCTQQDMAKVLEVVEEETAREHNMGWFDQYSRLINDINVRDIVVAVEENFVVAVALTYTPSCGSPVASDLPWAGHVGGDVGGVTCICIPR